MKTRIFTLLAVAGALAFAGAASAQTTATTDPVGVTPPTRPPLPDGLKDLIENFKDQRADILAARQALLEKLKTATEAEKKALIDEFRRAEKARIENERELRKAVREEIKKLRDERRSRTGTGTTSG